MFNSSIIVFVITAVIVINVRLLFALLQFYFTAIITTTLTNALLFFYGKNATYLCLPSAAQTHTYTHTHIERPPAYQVPHNLQVNLLTRMRAHISLNVRFVLMLLLSLIFFILCNLNIRKRAISGEFSPATIRM